MRSDEHASRTDEELAMEECMFFDDVIQNDELLRAAKQAGQLSSMTGVESGLISQDDLFFIQRDMARQATFLYKE
jgi:hypothetical protein